MYLEFFGLREQPFGVTPDPAFLYLSQTHREALEAIRSDLMTDRGFMALVGEPGLGKTTLLYKVLEEWRLTSRVVFLFQTQCDARDLLRHVLSELGVDAESMGLVAMHQKLNQLLFEEMLAGRRSILIIDEAQNLDDAVLETVRLLSNFETPHSKLLNIVLAGQSQLADRLAAPGLRQLRQRIGLMNRLRPLTAMETTEYVKHRLGLAGYCGEPIFTQGALQAIAKSSHGAPRAINQVCHHALCAAATEGTRTINLEIAQNVIAKLEGHSIEVGFSAAAPAVAEAVAPAVPVAAVTPVPAVTPAPEVAPAPAVALAAVTSALATPVPAPPPAVAAPPPVRSAPPATGMLLSYGWEKPRSPRSPRRWGVVAIASCAILLIGAASAVPQVRRFAWQEYKSLTTGTSGNSTDSAPVQSSTPSPASELGLPPYDPAPQDSDYGQVITVTPRTGETLEELSRTYAGHFDQQLSQQIYDLNPDIKDPNYLEAGQLIRLPLPAGTLKKVVDTDDPAKAPPPGKWQMAIAKVKELFSSAKP